MKIELVHANILDIEADVLVCSANIMLNLTGGVGADIIARYGTAMQGDLHAQIHARTPRCAQPGEVFAVQTPGLPYLAVLHAVAVDPMYHSSPAIITETVRRALSMAADYGARRVALTALASGFGDLTLDDFADGARPALADDYPPIDTVLIPQIEPYRYAELLAAFA